MAGSGRRVTGGKKIAAHRASPPPTRRPLPAARWEGGWYAHEHVARAHRRLALDGRQLHRVRAECDFRHQMSMEPIEIRVRIGDMQTTSFDTHYQFRKANCQQLAATGKVVVVLFDWKTQSTTPITDELRDKV